MVRFTLMRKATPLYIELLRSGPRLEAPAPKDWRPRRKPDKRIAAGKEILATVKLTTHVTVPDMHRRLDCAKSTVQAAMKDLINAGLIERNPKLDSQGYRGIIKAYSLVDVQGRRRNPRRNQS